MHHHLLALSNMYEEMHMNIYVCIYTYEYMYIYVRVCMHIIYIFTSASRLAPASKRMRTTCVHPRIYMENCIYIRTNSYTYEYMHMRVCVYT